MKIPKLKFKRTYFAFPYMFLCAIFIVLPLAILLFRAFQKPDGSITFDNFVTFFTSTDTLRTMGRSFLIAFLTTIFCLLIAYPLAMVLSNSKFNKSAILVLMFVLPMWINSLLRTYAIKSVFDIIGIKNDYVRVTIAMVYDFFPFMLLPLYTVMVNMEKSLIEASTDLGANSLMTFLKISLPLSVPGIISGVLMVFMPTISTFAISDIVAPNMWMLGNSINTYFEKGYINLGSAYAFILLALIAITMLASNKLTKGQTSAKGATSI